MSVYTYITVDLKQHSKHVMQIKNYIFSEHGLSNDQEYIYSPDKILDSQKCFCAIDEHDDVAGFVIIDQYHSNILATTTNVYHANCNKTLFPQPFILIAELFIREQDRRKGIATTLFDNIKKTFGADVKMRLNVSSFNVAAVNLYTKLGFYYFGLAKKYYTDVKGSKYYVGDGCDALVLINMEVD